VRVDPRFQQLYEAEFPAVFRAVYLLCGDRSDAEDATQEAFARALERWNRLKDEPWVGGWIMSTALNAARRAGRLHRRQAPMEEAVPETARTPGADVDSGVDLWRAVRRLPRRQQQAAVLYYVLDLSVSEVASVMGCRDGTVKAHLARAREALHRTMEVRGE
jgi:RNA polymerase sigma factor (sigma-70 family)